MRVGKRVLSLVLVIAVLFTMAPFSGNETKAATSVRTRMEEIRAVYPTGSYFTVQSSTSGCTSSNHDTVNGVWCQGCYLPSIPSRGGLPKGSAVGYASDTCCGFASYVFYCLYGHNHTTNTTQTSSPVFGDLVFTGSHWFIYLSEDSTNYYVYDANGYNGGKNKVIYNNYYPKSRVSSLTVYHAKNYVADVSYTYTSITQGTYYLKNKETGKFLNVSYGLDENQQNIHVYDYGSYTSEQFQITSTGNGYKMRPLCSSSRVVNAWGDNPSEGSNVNLYDDVSNSTQWWKFEAVSGGYIIHNVYNPSLVLDIGDSGVLVWTRHGGASQIWTLVPLNHTCDKGTYQYYWEAHPHYNCYKCSICEEIWEDTNSSNDVSSCEVCNPPHSCTFAGRNEIITEATCTEAGIKKVYCTDESCGKYETVSIAARGHQYTETIIAPTPTAQGYTEHTCSACGDSYKDNYTDYVYDDAPQLVMENSTASAGKEISVKLSLQNNTGIAGLAVSLKYDESVLTLKEVRKGNLFSGFTSGKNLVWDESKDVTADGILATVVFTVADNASAGDYKIEIITRSCTNANLEDVVPVTTAGIITIIDYLYGDANGDGDIDMKDIVLLQKYMANFDYDLNTSTVEVKAGADANGDGKVSGQDIVRLRRYLSEYDYETGSSTVVLGP